VTDRRRCAIYTRKSSDEGLEQDFNSLHAQREACEAFIKSQKHEGWELVHTEYDDGGFSAGTMERPALKRLLADIKATKVQVIVVYKVDRLTRSLADFAKIVEILDAQAASFVSITQQFNTTTSMGRLTLNMLLSFAQFEREVTAERIRDKIAASKKKGIWMGGLPPLGYDVKDRGLLVNPEEAKTVRTLFRLYRELGTVRQLKDAADRMALMTKRRRETSGRVTGGARFTRGHLYCLLSNHVYIGEITHKDAHYQGRHEAIIDRKLFDDVQHQLAGNAVERRSARNGNAPSLLAGLIYDETGERLSPTHANKKGQRYRYYISKRLMHSGGTDSGGWRLPARELESVVLNVVSEFLNDKLRIIEALALDDASPERLRIALRKSEATAQELKDLPLERQRDLLAQLVRRIVLAPERLEISLDRTELGTLLTGFATEACSGSEHVLAIPMQLRRRGVEAKIVMANRRDSALEPDATLLTLLSEAHRWIAELVHGEATSVRGIARRNKRDPGEVSRTLPLAFLAPKIIEATVEGKQPFDITARRLKRIGLLPWRWEDQCRRLNIST
jgi:site-specific DNA recombinase